MKGEEQEPNAYFLFHPVLYHGMEKEEGRDSER